MKLYNKDGQLINIDEKKEIARGGEGAVIEIGQNKVAKIYHPGNRPLTLEKFRYLSDLDGTSFVRPEHLLFDKKKNIAGFIMQMLPKNFFPLYSAYSYNFCSKQGITEKGKLAIVKKLIKNVNAAHEKGVVIGDLNPFNIMLNDTGLTFFIDVDSYETPGTKHSGKLLDDIRDHLYMGRINKESDYYALAVIVFNFLTNLHPYKGVHKKHGSIPERAINKIPVFDNDPQLIIPKCYHPLKDKLLMDQFTRIFKKGERFAISTDATGNVIHVINLDKVIEKEGELSINKILVNTEIRYVNASNTIACVATNEDIIVYDLQSKSYHREIGRLKRTTKDLAPLPTNKNFFTYENGKLFKYDLKTFERVEMDDLGIKNPIMAKQYGNIFVVLEDNKMYTIYLDSCIGTHIKFDTKPVFGGSFQKYRGMFQHFGENTYLRYNYKDTLNTVVYNKVLKDVYQNGDIGIAQTVENNKIKFDMFRIRGLKVEKFLYPLSSIRHFGYNPGNFIIMPEDDQLVLLRSDNLQPIAKFKCSVVSEDSEVFYTQAGILINNGKNLYLVNKK